MADHVAKLASNENPLGASPKAIEAMTRDLAG
jgi:histidinol-phosphate/aromatic aminotransferase/cobyric acid decarboxylase-like protein